LQSKDVLRQLDLTAAHVHKALLSLENFGVLRKEYKRTEVSYQFEDPMFRNWILERTTT
jgi:predicted transcriptional regulator